MARYIRTLTIIYDIDIENWEIPLFRGAVIRAMGSAANILFHNHTGNELRYGYPLIQYKRMGGKAGIVAVDRGTDMIGQFAVDGCDKLIIGQRVVPCNVVNIRPCRILAQLWESAFHYHLSRWLPLNAKNYEVFNMLQDTEERKIFLERILRGNLLAMLKGLKIWLDGHLTIHITSLSDPYLLEYKGVKLMAFNADFDTNLSIPSNLGIGKHTSVGFGTIHRLSNNPNNPEQ